MVAIPEDKSPLHAASRIQSQSTGTKSSFDDLFNDAVSNDKTKPFQVGNQTYAISYLNQSYSGSSVTDSPPVKSDQIPDSEPTPQQTDDQIDIELIPTFVISSTQMTDTTPRKASEIVPILIQQSVVHVKQFINQDIRAFKFVFNDLPLTIQFDLGNDQHKIKINVMENSQQLYNDLMSRKPELLKKLKKVIEDDELELELFLDDKPSYQLPNQH